MLHEPFPFRCEASSEWDRCAVDAFADILADHIAECPTFTDGELFGLLLVANARREVEPHFDAALAKARAIRRNSISPADLDADCIAAVEAAVAAPGA